MSRPLPGSAVFALLRDNTRHRSSYSFGEFTQILNSSQQREYLIGGIGARIVARFLVKRGECFYLRRRVADFLPFMRAMSVRHMKLMKASASSLCFAFLRITIASTHRFVPSLGTAYARSGF